MFLLNIFDYTIIIIVLLSFIPYIDLLIDDNGYLIIKFIKFVLKSILYFLIPMLYILYYIIVFKIIINMNLNYIILNIFNQ